MRAEKQKDETFKTDKEVKFPVKTLFQPHETPLKEVTYRVSPLGKHRYLRGGRGRDATVSFVKSHQQGIK